MTELTTVITGVRKCRDSLAPRRDGGRCVPGDSGAPTPSSEEENVCQIQRIGENGCETQLEIEEPAGRRQKEQPVEKRAASSDRWVAKSGDLARGGSRNPQTSGRQQRQQVARGFSESMLPVKLMRQTPPATPRNPYRRSRRQPRRAEKAPPDKGATATITPTFD